MSEFKWTKIDPAVHTEGWFLNYPGVTFLWKGSYSIEPVAFTRYTSGFDLKRATHFLLHPPLPDPLEEEIEREAMAYSVSLIARQDFIAGARAFLGKGKS